MAKKFAGFKTETLQNKILPALGYSGPMNQKSINAFLASNPAAAAKMGKYTLAARRAIEGQQVKMAEGGMTPYDNNMMMQRRGYTSAPMQGQFISPSFDPVEKLPLSDAAIKGEFNLAYPAPQPVQLPEGLLPVEPRPGGSLLQPRPQPRPTSGGVPPHSHTISMAQGGAVRGFQEGGDAGEDEEENTTPPPDSPANVMTKAITSDPTKLVTTAGVVSDTGEGTTIAEGTGQAGVADTATTTTAEEAPSAVAAEKPEAATVSAKTVSTEVQDTLSKVEAATGKIGPDALAEAATMSPDKLASLGLTAAQITQAQTVKAPAPRKIEKGEMIEGATVDMERVKKEVNFEAATGAPSTDATVQGQLTGLMEAFEGGATPAWAAGAMRGAAAMMAARGLSASSMAGQAAIQAAMESALPIAQADASTFARFEQQNLSNRQQSAMFAAEKRAEFLGMEFTQEFQTRVANAAKISDIANMNFNAEQTIALENARLAQSVDLANLDARNAKVLADAAAMSQVDITNLNNRQQAAVQNAQNFLAMDMANLNNEQQTAIFRTQQNVQSLFTDQAAENAAAQFNAANENQTRQFFSSLSAQTSQFNASQTNAVNQFNVNATNAVRQFNSNLQQQRDTFNATNSLVVAQANAQWRQNIATLNTAAQNESNAEFAKTINAMTSKNIDAVWQRERDLMDMNFKSTEDAKDRALQILLGDQTLQALREKIGYGEDQAKSEMAFRFIFGNWL